MANITFWERTTGGNFPPFQHTVSADLENAKIANGEGIELNMKNGEVYEIRFDESVAHNGWWAKDSSGRICRVTIEQ